MKIEIRDDHVEVDGYVTAIERFSKVLHSRCGKFKEIIREGVFKRAISKNDDIQILLNHQFGKNLGSTKKGNLFLKEDNIGLKVRAEIHDPDVVEKAKNGDLVGWSFGFKDVDVKQKMDGEVLVRDVNDIDLVEVSILDRTRSPAYKGNTIELVTRNENGETLMFSEPFDSGISEEKSPGNEKIEKRNEPTQKDTIDYSECENIIKKMKGI